MVDGNGGDMPLGRHRSRQGPKPAEGVTAGAPASGSSSLAPPGQRRVVSATPPVYEAPLELIQGLITPTAFFFLRNHYSTPIIDPKTWRLRIEGSAVERPVELNYDDILNMRSRSQLTLVECAGNGRSLYGTFGGRPAPGAAWRLGGVSVGEWTGVSLAEVLNQAGVKSTGIDVLLEGEDEGEVARPIPLKVAMDPGTILAYALNGEFLPPEHGFPLRAIVPGWTGISSIKWLGRIAVEDRPIKTRYNTDQYVLKGPEYPDNPPVMHYGVKSAVALSWNATVPSGIRTVRGFAWSPYGRITRLEYSLDEGKIWAEARLLEPNTPFAWTRWEITWPASPGNYTIITRATDEAGNTQPDRMPWNDLGYLYHAVVPHPVQVV